MSSRHLRRVLDDKSLDETQISDDEGPVRKPTLNLASFGVLLTSDEEEDETSEDLSDNGNDDDDEEEKAVKDVKSKEAKEPDVDSDEEFEAALSQLKTKVAQAKDEGLVLEEDLDQFLVLLAPNPASMDPLAELKRKIGNFNPAAAGAADQRFAGLIERKTASNVGRGFGKGPIRKGRHQIVSPQPTWPTVPATVVGLKLLRVGNGPGFIMEHSQEYLQGLRTAVYLMRQGDIDGLVALIHAGHPYQVDALLVISDYVRMSSSSEAAELIEWSIYLMERCMGTGLGTSFNPFSEKDRGSLLPYDYAENRKMHLALFRHVQYQLKRGCYKTATEFCKLMICLDVNDPLMVMPLMAVSALQAGHYEWIMEMREAMGEWKWDQVDWQLASILAYFKMDRFDEASALLVDFCQSYPGAVSLLIEASGIIKTIPDTMPCCPHVNALVKIFINRTSALWKDRQVTTWLQSALPDLQSTQNQEETVWSESLEHAKIYRHTLLSDVPNLNIALPPGMSSMELNVYDPIPPEKVGASSSSVVGMLADSLANIFGRFHF